MLTAVAPQSYASFDREWGERDGWADYPELAGHPVWAVDGHQITPATHSQRDGKGRSPRA